MLHLFIKHCLPLLKRRRRGAVGCLLVTLFVVLIVLLPIGVTGLRQLQDLVLYMKARQYLEQTLPAAFNCLDPISLAYGQPKYDFSAVDNLLKTRFTGKMPESLRGRLELKRIEFSEFMIPPDPDHWMGSRQQSFLPTITMFAVLTSHQGMAIPLNYTIEFVVD